MTRPLPRPETRQDVYLHDIATSLRTLAGRNVEPLGHMRLQEPATVTVGPAKKGGWHELVDADGQVVEKVRGRRNAERRAAELMSSRAS